MPRSVNGSVEPARFDALGEAVGQADEAALAGDGLVLRRPAPELAVERGATIRGLVGRSARG